MTLSPRQTVPLALFLAVFPASGGAFAPLHQQQHHSTFPAFGASHHRHDTLDAADFKRQGFVLQAASDPGAVATTPPKQNEEVVRLQAMAAQLRQEAARLEFEQKQAISQATQSLFQRWDTDSNGELSLVELKLGMERLFKLDKKQQGGIPESRVQQVLQAFDTNGDGALQLDEFYGAERLKSKLDAIARDEQAATRQAAKQAREQQEAQQLKQAQLAIVNDGPPTATDKIVSVLPYLFPLVDGLAFARFFIESSGPDNPLATAALLAYGLYRAIPFSGLISFFALTVLSENPKINRLVRFNLQQAVFLDIALFAPALVASLGSGLAQAAGFTVPPALTEVSSDVTFVALLAAVGYAVTSSLTGQTPDKLPLVSERVEERMITPEMFDANTGKFAPFDDNGNIKRGGKGKKSDDEGEDN